MEATVVNPDEIIIDDNAVIVAPGSSFIEANTLPVSLEHLKRECTIPVFSKDNEITISHYNFIRQVHTTVKKHFKDFSVGEPNIRVSHIIKGRVPSAVGKAAKDLKENEKTLYYERCAFMIELSSEEVVNGNLLQFTIGGVRAYNQENLYSRKSAEKFKLFIGYKNKVCTNLCISTDGFSNEIKALSVDELQPRILELIERYNDQTHLNQMRRMADVQLSEEQFAHLIGKLRMCQYLDRAEQKNLHALTLNDGQLNSVVRNYYSCPNFSRDKDKKINLWRLYNLFTEANKSSYIDSTLERNVSAYEFTNFLTNSIETQSPNWFIH